MTFSRVGMDPFLVRTSGSGLCLYTPVMRMSLLYATVAIGLEDLAEAEARRLGLHPVPLRARMRGRVAFHSDSVEEGLFRLLTGARILHRVGVYVGETDLPAAKTLDHLREWIFSLPWEDWIDAGVAFAARAARRGNQPFRSPDIERETGTGVVEALRARKGIRARVNLRDPDLIVRVDLDEHNHAVAWVDGVGMQSLHRRGYRAYEHPAPMKGTLAAALLDLVRWDPQERLLDPMAGGGTLGIEAAWKALGIPPILLRTDTLLVSRIPRLVPVAERIRHMLQGLEIPPCSLEILLADRFRRHVEGMRRNLRLARVETCVRVVHRPVQHLSRWLDRVDVIVTNPPYGLRVADPRETERVYDALLEQAVRVLTPEGRLGMFTPRDDLVDRFSRKHGFRVVHQRGVYHGKLPVRIYILSPDATPHADP